MTEKTPKAWAGLAAKELKSRSLAELTWAAPEGFDVKPLYTAADLEGIESARAILMTERFSNQAVTTLSAAITTTTATSCTVTDATMFPTAGNFRIKIDAEILIVTTVAANAFTITGGAEGTVAAHARQRCQRHSSVDQGQYWSGWPIGSSPISMPTSPPPGSRDGCSFPRTGCSWNTTTVRPGTSTVPTGGSKSPPQTGWIWVNQGNATVTYTGSTLVLEEPDLGTGNPQIRALVRPLSVPGATTITAAFTFNGIASERPAWGSAHGTWAARLTDIRGLGRPRPRR